MGGRDAVLTAARNAWREAVALRANRDGGMSGEPMQRAVDPTASTKQVGPNSINTSHVLPRCSCHMGLHEYSAYGGDVRPTEQTFTDLIRSKTLCVSGRHIT